MSRPPELVTEADAAPPEPAAAPAYNTMAQLYRDHNEALVRFLMTRVDSEQEARDVAQEAYVRMLQLHSPGVVSFLSGYLFKTASNIAIDRMRSRTLQRRVASRDDSQDRHDAPPEQHLEAREQLELIDRFVEELPPKCQQAFLLHRIDNVSPPEIAARLGVTKRMVHHYLVRALAHVQSGLDAAARGKEYSNER